MPSSRLCVLGLVGSGAASAASGPWVTLIDRPGGFKLTIQKSWYLVPNSPASVQSIILQLRNANQAGVARVYTEILGSSDVRRFWFEAFDYSALAAIQPTVTLGIARSTKALTSSASLVPLAAAFAKSFAATPQTTVTLETVVTLPEGPRRVRRSHAGVPGSSLLIEVYVIPHGTRLYQLSFATDAASSTDAVSFAEIAQRFAFS